MYVLGLVVLESVKLVGMLHWPFKLFNLNFLYFLGYIQCLHLSIALLYNYPFILLSSWWIFWNFCSVFCWVFSLDYINMKGLKKLQVAFKYSFPETMEQLSSYRGRQQNSVMIKYYGCLMMRLVSTNRVVV